MFPPDFLAAAEAVLGACRARGWQVTTAESCTGGLIAGLLTAIGGSSDVVDGGAVYRAHRRLPANGAAIRPFGSGRRRP